MNEVILFDPAAFRALFKAFADTSAYPNQVLQLWWDTGTNYVSDLDSGIWCGDMSLSQRTLALNYITAHLVYLADQIAAGQQTGFVSSSTIDKVSVTMVAPPVPNQWQFWLTQSPYGQQLLALLEVASAGGDYIAGPRPGPLFGFRC